MLANSVGVATHVESVSLVLLAFGSANSTSEEVSVFLLREVDVIVTMGVRVNSGVPSVILPHTIRAKVSGLTVVPSLELKITHRSVPVKVRNAHGALVGVIIDHFGAEVPLLLLTESFENVIRAHFHNRDLVSETGVFRAGLCLAHLVSADFLDTTAGDEVRSESHVLGLLEGR